MSNDTNSSIANSTINNDMDPAYIEIFREVIYRGLNLVYLTIGLVGNLILLMAFYKQSKTEKAYGYQVIFTISKTLEIFCFGTFLCAHVWFDSSAGGGWPWFTKQYPLMFIFAYLFLTAHVTLINCSLLVAVAMAADRVFAIVKPIVYRTIDHRKHQAVATICCLLLGFLGNATWLFHWGISKNGDHYSLMANEMNHNFLGKVFFNIRLATRTIGLGTLIILNVVMIVMFKRKKRKIESTPSSNSIAQKRDQKQRGVERTLLWVNIYQACMMAINQLPHVTWVAMQYVRPEYEHTEYGLVTGPACDAMVMLTDTLDFFIVIALNGKMRRLVKNVLFGRCDGSKVTPANTGAATTSAMAVAGMPRELPPIKMTGRVTATRVMRIASKDLLV